MKIPSRAAALLAELSDTLDDPDVDIVRSLTRFAAQVKSAVPSSLGVSVEMTTEDSHVDVEAMEDSVAPGSICSSMRIPPSIALRQASGPTRRGEQIAVILYAAAPGALVNLAADMAWLTSLPLTDFALDEHLGGPKSSRSTVEDVSVLNQAIGMLLTRGLAPEQSLAEIDRRAARTGLSRIAVAAGILAETATPFRPRNPSSKR